MRKKRLSAEKKQKRNLPVAEISDPGRKCCPKRLRDSFPWKRKQFHRFIYNYSFVIARRIKKVKKVVCCSHQSDRLGYVSRTNQIAALRHVSRTAQSVVFVLWFERCSNFNEVMGDSAKAGRKM